MKLEFNAKRVCGRYIFIPIDPVSETFISLGQNKRKVGFSSKDFIQILKLKRIDVEVVVWRDKGAPMSRNELFEILEGG